MVDWQTIQRLMNCFPNSIINHDMEFIAHVRANEYFILRDCKTELDIKCKVLEWLSRAAHKSQPFRRTADNDYLHDFMLKGINEFLGVCFTKNDMELIYTYLGNACNHRKTIRFIESGYNMNVLKESEG